MKKVAFIFVWVSSISCTYKNLPAPSNIGENLTAYQGDVVTIRDPQASNFSIQVVSILDSRCPVDAFCFAAGEAVVKFEIASTAFSLKIGQSGNFSVGLKNYRITLKNVLPFPSLANADAKRQAVFFVERQ